MKIVSNWEAETMKFTWEDVVGVKSDAPLQFRPNHAGVVVGSFRIESEAVADARGWPIGTILYTIEFPDGNALEIPEGLLELLSV